jgi:hypothetical protein
MVKSWGTSLSVSCLVERPWQTLAEKICLTYVIPHNGQHDGLGKTVYLIYGTGTGSARKYFIEQARLKTKISQAARRDVMWACYQPAHPSHLQWCISAWSIIFFMYASPYNVARRRLRPVSWAPSSCRVFDDTVQTWDNTLAYIVNSLGESPDPSCCPQKNNSALGTTIHPDFVSCFKDIHTILQESFSRNPPRESQ